MAEDEHSIELVAENEVCPRSPSRLLDLPDELLELILSFVILRPKLSSIVDCRCSWERKRNATALLQTCQRLYHVALPLVYRRLTFRFGSLVEDRNLSKRTLKLYRHLQTNRYLCTLCKALDIILEDFPETPQFKTNISIVNEIVSMLTNVRCLHLHKWHKIGYPNWTYNTLRHMSMLKHLTVDYALFGSRTFTPPPLLEKQRFKSISRLDVVGPLPSSFRMKDIDKRVYSAMFSTLIIAKFPSRPEVLRGMVNLTKRLEHFAYGELKYSQSLLHLGDFNFILEKHRRSLRSIKIEHLNGGVQADHIDLSLFEALYTLSLSRWNIDVAKLDLVKYFHAPRLHTFELDFTLFGDDEDWEDFSAAEAWLRSFATLGSCRSPSLQAIKIVFNPTTEVRPGLMYPWDGIDKVAQDLIPLGITLSYNKPVISKLEFLEEMRSVKSIA